MAELKQRVIRSFQSVVAASKRLKKGLTQTTNDIELNGNSFDTGLHILSRKRFLLASAVLGLSMTATYFIHSNAETEVYKVYYQNTYLGMVHSKQEVASALKSITQDRLNRLTYTPVHVTSDMKFMPLNTKLLAEEFTPVAIEVNHKPFVAVANREEANDVIENVKQFYLKDQPGDTKAYVEDTISFVPTQDVSNIKDKAEAVHELLGGADTPEMYIVSRGDTLWDISQKENVPVDRLVSSNPSLRDQNSLQLGQQLVINKFEPVIHVKVEQTVTKDVTVPFTTQYIDDDTMAAGDTKVITKGEDGLETQTLHITYENGNVLKQDVLARTVKKQMVQAVVRRGTNSGVASGDYIWPTASHVITSPYGEHRGNEIHPGVDIGSYTGAPIWASNNGTVIAAGWDNGGYGNCVRIDHGNGVVSIYGHMSRVDVKVGQRVTKGQQIGAVGMTGEATGPHLHYEIHVNGVRTNPAPYM
jgi:murein DD-endopeptidase MepM/ murein hydrolase activator NlpD/nucleoid-associated protein YgaU